jgi:8-oxo-dGTP pyrophosphatase MutT (NUDIX family)
LTESVVSRPPLTPFQARLVSRLAGRTPVTVEDPLLARAAVALVAVPDPDALLLIRRAERPGDPWSGQMGLPGGRTSPEDAGLLETAIRETREEVGISLLQQDLVGPLDDVAPRSPHLPPLMVRPFLFVLSQRPVVTPNREVADHLWVEWGSLVHPESYRPHPVRLGGTVREFPAYHVSPVPVWGMTERILAPLVELLSAD